MHSLEKAGGAGSDLQSDFAQLRRRWSESGGVVSDTGARLAWEREIREIEVPPPPEIPWDAMEFLLQRQLEV